jgi:cytochrome c-type biogenesis protein CcmH/NrfG
MQEPQSGPLTPKPNNLPLIIACLVTALLGYGVGRVQGGLTAADAAQKAENAQQAAETAKDAISKVEQRADQCDAHRHIALAQLSLNQGQTDVARDHLKQAGDLLGKRDDAVLGAIGKSATALSQDAQLSGHKSQVTDLSKKLDELIPVPMQLGR